MRTPTPSPSLRQCVLAVSVLSSVDILLDDGGVRLAAAPDDLVRWEDLADAVGPYPADGDAARRRVEGLLRARELAGRWGERLAGHLLDVARVVAVPPGHVDHLGPDWVREPLRGGALDLGIGVVGLPGAHDRAVPLPPSVMEAAGLDIGRLWPHVRGQAERMGALAAGRLERDGLERGLLRPVGGCDVLALLASSGLRARISAGDGSGLRALGVPTRRRGWFDISRIDPAFVAAAWSATDEQDRGVDRPLVVTSDDVVVFRRD